MTEFPLAYCFAASFINMLHIIYGSQEKSGIANFASAIGVKAHLLGVNVAFLPKLNDDGEEIIQV
jgi:hypothetical protein